MPLVNNVLIVTSTSDDAAESIRSAIASGRLRPGEKINQRVLAKELGITTTPLREALSSLERDGTVQRVSGLGVFVRKYSADEVRQFYLLREVLEGLAARLAAENATEKQIARLDKLASDVTEARTNGDIATMKELEVAFHELLAAASGAELLGNQLKRMLFIRMTIVYLSSPTANEIDFVPEADHSKIVAAIRERDGIRAEAAMRKHIVNGYKSYLTWTQESEE